jgi:hypothetical protein
VIALLGERPPAPPGGRTAGGELVTGGVTVRVAETFADTFAATFAVTFAVTGTAIFAGHDTRWPRQDLPELDC